MPPLLAKVASMPVSRKLVTWDLTNGACKTYKQSGRIVVELTESNDPKNGALCEVYSDEEARTDSRVGRVMRDPPGQCRKSFTTCTKTPPPISCVLVGLAPLDPTNKGAPPA
jgi:hypothetical protein